LTFQYFPTSQVYKYSAVDLKPDGEEQALTLGNIEEYIHLLTDFCLYSGIKKQMDAFRGNVAFIFFSAGHTLAKIAQFTQEYGVINLNTYLLLRTLDGFNQVFPMEKLQPFSPSELQLMISGEQVPQWTKEDVLSYTEPKYGFTRDSAVYQRFVNVLADMSGEEKKVGTVKYH
jgi:E3 ubiquitin-protein ligase HECTD1